MRIDSHGDGRDVGIATALRRFTFLEGLLVFAEIPAAEVSGVVVRGGLFGHRLLSEFGAKDVWVGGRNFGDIRVFAVKDGAFCDVLPPVRQRIGNGLTSGGSKRSLAEVFLFAAGGHPAPSAVLDADHVVWCKRPVVYERGDRVVVRRKIVVYAFPAGYSLRKAIADAKVGAYLAARAES